MHEQQAQEDLHLGASKSAAGTSVSAVTEIHVFERGVGKFQLGPVVLLVAVPGEAKAVEVVLTAPNRFVRRRDHAIAHQVRLGGDVGAVR